MLHIYNTEKRKKEVFTPIHENLVRMYVCGMTVYDYCHLGHARVLVVFDMIYRYLMHKGYDVTYVRNITDIDDKIIARANENGEGFQALTARFIMAMHEDSDALGVLRPSIEPKATDSIPEIISMIKTLIEKKHAYFDEASGDVFYSVKTFKPYGRLSGKNLEDLQAGERVEVNSSKRDPLDFVLWKSAKPEEPSWESPWGDGRPGWHIECSAMSNKCLGSHFDIHGGGQDLQFPHHENEIAQSEAATCSHYVNYWIHNGFVRINEEKMSKSLGNFFTVRDVLNNYRAEAIRFFILNSQYRSPLNYSDAQLDSASKSIERLYTALRGVGMLGQVLPEYEARFIEAMDDDFNSAQAIAVLFEVTTALNKAKGEEKANLAATLKGLGGVLGLLQDDPEIFFQSGNSSELEAEKIDALIAERAQAKAQKDWAKADEIRNQLASMNVVIEDSATGTTWRVE